MEHNEVLDWLREHPQEVHETPERILSRCEAEVQDHVIEETWLFAREVARERERYWRKDGGGAHASEAFVAREVCRELAAELRQLEPVPQPGHARDYVGTDTLAPLESEARGLMLRYVLDLACREEHQLWHDVVQFTREKGTDLAQQQTFSKELDFERTHGYAETAARVMHILATDYESHAHMRAR